MDGRFDFTGWKLVKIAPFPQIVTLRVPNKLEDCPTIGPGRDLFERVLGMEARFAGSQRVGDRRRRRLAVGADENADTSHPNFPDQTDSLAAPAGEFRAVDGPHTDGPSAVGAIAPVSPTLNLPVSAVIPAAGWKYLVGGVLGLAISAGIIAAGYFSSRLESIAGAEIADLLALPNSRLAQWFSSLLLLLCAQLAMFIWWARSRSLEDFDGRYWLWIHTAGVWFVLSGCLSTEAHTVVSGAIRLIRSGISQRDANLGWMIPMGILGIMLARALAREMRGCRASRALLLTACAVQLLTAALHLELESVLSPAVRGIFVQAGLLTGHVALFVSMWLHARHVVHYSADPAPGPSRAWRIPMPHFRFTKSKWMQAWRNRSNAIASPVPIAGQKTERRQPAKKSNAASASQPPSNAVTESLAGTPVERPGKPHIRFDGRHRDAASQTVPNGPASADPAPIDPAAEQIDAGTGQERRPRDLPAATGPWKSPPARLPDSVTRPAVDVSNGLGELASDTDETPEDGPGDGPEKPELRGLSKKQRRRLMQELRDRQRASR